MLAERAVATANLKAVAAKVAAEAEQSLNLSLRRLPLKAAAAKAAAETAAKERTCCIIN